MEGISNININSDIFSSIINNNSISSNEAATEDKSKIQFENVLGDAIGKVNESQVNANNMIEALIKGDDVAVHDVMLSVQESQMSMQLMLEVRNKLYEAYQELNGVQL